MKNKITNVKNYEGLYVVDVLGNIYSLNTNKRLKPWFDKDGYAKVGLCKNGKKITLSVHRIVLQSFCGESELQCNHRDCDKKNNKLENLEWVTQKQNINHSVKNGLHPSGEKNGNAKLTNSQVDRIRFINEHCCVEKGYWKKLRGSLGITNTALWYIKTYKTYNIKEA